MSAVVSMAVTWQGVKSPGDFKQWSLMACLVHLSCSRSFPVLIRTGGESELPVLEGLAGYLSLLFPAGHAASPQAAVPILHHVIYTFVFFLALWLSPGEHVNDFIFSLCICFIPLRLS